MLRQNQCKQNGFWSCNKPDSSQPKSIVIYIGPLFHNSSLWVVRPFPSFRYSDSLLFVGLASINASLAACGQATMRRLAASPSVISLVLRRFGELRLVEMGVATARQASTKYVDG